MPIYEYQCLQCGKRTEALQKMADPHLATCEACGGELKRLISSPAVQFKGSGWYVTDYARGGGAKGATGDANKSEAKGEAKGESRGEGQAEGTATSKPDSGGGDAGPDKAAPAPSASPSGGGPPKAD